MSEDRTALFVYGGAAFHHPKECADVFVPLLEGEGFNIQLTESMDVFLDRDKINALSLIVHIRSLDQITDDQFSGLSAAVNAGVGLAGFHGGIIDAYRDHTGWQWLTGGQFVAHPGPCRTYTVNVTDTEHPIMQGMGDFVLEDTEQYWMHVDPGNHVLATTTFTGEYGGQPGVVMPYAWTRPWGDGRIFFAAWGHSPKDFDGAEAREIVKRGMAWAARA